LNIFISSGYLPSNFEVVQNRAKFWMFLAPKTVLGRALKILDQHYKIHSGTDHRAKFHADQPIHLKHLALK